MHTRFSRILLVAVLALAVMDGGMAWAGKPSGQAGRGNDQPQQRTRQNESGDDDMPSSVRRIQHETGGQVLKAQPILRDGHQIYRVKVLTPQGRIRIVEDPSPTPRDNSQPARGDDATNDHRPE